MEFAYYCRYALLLIQGQSQSARAGRKFGTRGGFSALCTIIFTIIFPKLKLICVSERISELKTNMKNKRR